MKRIEPEFPKKGDADSCQKMNLESTEEVTDKRSDGTDKNTFYGE